MCEILSFTFDVEEDRDEVNVYSDNLYIVSKKGQVNFSSAGWNGYSCVTKSVSFSSSDARFDL